MPYHAGKMPVSGQKKLEKNIFLIPPLLAAEIGASAATVLQQIHYWVQNPKCGSVIDGVRWIYNTYEQWQKQLKYLSISTIRRAIAKLRDMNLILIEQHDKSEWNHRNYYTVNYESLKALQLSICSERTDGNVLNEQMDISNLDTSSITKITPENTSKKTTTLVAVKQKVEQEVVVRPKTTVLADQEDIEQVEQNPVEDDSAAAERLELVENAGIKLNATLEKTVLQYTLEQVQNAIAYYREVVKEKGRRSSPGGWLTDCLRGEWWKDRKLPEEDRYPAGFLEAYQRLIELGLVLDCKPNSLPTDGYKQPFVRVSSDRAPGGYELVLWSSAVDMLEGEQN